MRGQRQQLIDLVRAVAKDGGASWLETNCAAVADDPRALAQLFPAVSRHVGRGALGAPADTNFSVQLGGQRYDLSIAAWRVDDTARVALLLAAKEHDAASVVDLARGLYFDGDARERAAVMRGLSLISGDEVDDVALPAVLDALRVNQGAIFEATVCENAYTAAVLPDLEYRKAVLKSVFVGLSIKRICGLERRADAALATSMVQFAEEREAASRGVPVELWPIVALNPPPGVAGKLLGYLEHPNREHRIGAAIGLQRLRAAGDERLTSFLQDRAERESDVDVKQAIVAALG